MRNELHKQLMALGIPLERHDSASLVRVFPPELKVANFDLSQTDIAEILVTFVKRGLVSVSLSGEAATTAALSAGAGHGTRSALAQVCPAIEFF